MSRYEGYIEELQMEIKQLKKRLENAIELPVKYDSWVYVLHRDNKISCENVYFVTPEGFLDNGDNFRYFSDIGNTIFLTYKEAEIALQNRIGKENNERKLGENK